MTQHSVSVSFHGAAGMVTGACFRVDGGAAPFLVDCGLVQGPKTLQGLNTRPFPFAPRALGAVVLTHAHIDHSGLLPRLVAAGFAGPIHATPATCELLRWLLQDAAAIQEAEAERFAKRAYRRGQTAVRAPLYTREDAAAAIERLRPTPIGAAFAPVAGVAARYGHAGHILGAAWVALDIGDRRIVFSGDLGPKGKTLQRDPEPAPAADLIVLESTYGGRERPPETEESRREKLAAEVLDAHRAGGNLLIPAFAVERTQELIHDLLVLARASRIPAMPIYLDSPLARRATAVFERYEAELEPVPDSGAAFRAGHLRAIETVEQSKDLARVKSGAILIAGSGMCDAGRIKHHLKEHLWRPRSTVLFVGYQAPGTLGRLLRDGVSPVRIHGEEIAVAARIRTLDSYSGHAGQSDLLAWAHGSLAGDGHIALTHGEPDQLAALRAALMQGGVAPARLHVPALDDALGAEPGGWRLKPDGAARALRQAADAGSDWHNAYARTIMSLRATLEAQTDDDARRRVLDAIERSLRAAGPAH